MTPTDDYTGPPSADAGPTGGDGTLRAASAQVTSTTAGRHPGLTVGFDATPLLGPRTGIGTYVHRLVTGLAAARSGTPAAARSGTTSGTDTVSEVALVATPFTVRGRRAPDDLPAGVRWSHRPVPARAARWCWRQGLPLSVELFSGRVEVFHGTNFVLPPLRSAAGVLTVHDLTYLRHPDWVDAASRHLVELVPRGLRSAGAVVTPSRAVADELADAYPHAADRLLVTPLGVEDDWFDAIPATPAELARLGLPARFVLAVGTLEPRKGLDVLVRAHAQATAEDGDVPPLVLVGGTGWGDLPEVRAAWDRVFLPGYLDRGTLRGVVAAADLFAFPSRYEGFGLPPLEALAAGVPVVASDLPVTREVLAGHAGYAPVDDVPALAAALLDALRATPSPQARAAGVAHARASTWDRCVTTTLAAYRAALGR